MTMPRNAKVITIASARPAEALLSISILSVGVVGKIAKTPF